jgi:cytochrome c2
MKRRLPFILFGLAAIASHIARVAMRPKVPAPVHNKDWTLICGSMLALVVISVTIYVGGSYASDPSRGRAASHLQKYGCVGCHTIPGIPNAVGRVGPPLAGLAQRTFVGGAVRNEPEALADWIVDPPKTDPRTAMPRTGISLTEARDVVEYLYRR